MKCKYYFECEIDCHRTHSYMYWHILHPALTCTQFICHVQYFLFSSLQFRNHFWFVCTTRQSHVYGWGKVTSAAPYKISAAINHVNISASVNTELIWTFSCWQTLIRQQLMPHRPVFLVTDWWPLRASKITVH